MARALRDACVHGRVEDAVRALTAPTSSASRFEASALSTASCVAALHVACAHGHAEVVCAMLEVAPQHVSQHAQNRVGWAPLHTAAWGVAREVDTRHVVQVLLDLGADVHARTTDGLGHEALHLARTSAAARVLVEHGASVDAEDRLGNTPLLTSCAWGCVDVAEVLLQHGARATHKNHRGRTALHVAAERGQHDVLAFLLARDGAAEAVGVLDAEGHTALHVACQHGQLRCAHALLAAGADAYVLARDGRTPLHDAVREDHVPVVRLLVERFPALCVVVDDFGCTPLEYTQGAATGRLLAVSAKPPPKRTAPPPVRERMARRPAALSSTAGRRKLTGADVVAHMAEHGRMGLGGRRRRLLTVADLEEQSRRQQHDDGAPRKRSKKAPRRNMGMAAGVVPSPATGASPHGGGAAGSGSSSGGGGGGAGGAGGDYHHHHEGGRELLRPIRRQRSASVVVPSHTPGKMEMSGLASLTEENVQEASAGLSLDMMSRLAISAVHGGPGRHAARSDTSSDGGDHDQRALSVDSRGSDFDSEGEGEGEKSFLPVSLHKSPLARGDSHMRMGVLHSVGSDTSSTASPRGAGGFLDVGSGPRRTISAILLSRNNQDSPVSSPRRRLSGDPRRGDDGPSDDEHGAITLLSDHEDGAGEHATEDSDADAMGLGSSKLIEEQGDDSDGSEGGPASPKKAAPRRAKLTMSPSMPVRGESPLPVVTLAKGVGGRRKQRRRSGASSTAAATGASQSPSTAQQVHISNSDVGHRIHEKGATGRAKDHERRKSTGEELHHDAILGRGATKPKRRRAEPVRKSTISMVHSVQRKEKRERKAKAKAKAKRKSRKAHAAVVVPRRVSDVHEQASGLPARGRGGSRAKEPRKHKHMRARSLSIEAEDLFGSAVHDKAKSVSKARKGKKSGGKTKKRAKDTSDKPDASKAPPVRARHTRARTLSSHGGRELLRMMQAQDAERARLSKEGDVVLFSGRGMGGRQRKHRDA